LLAATALIERSLHELERHAGAPATLLLTGGGAPPLRPWLGAHEHVEDLVLHGLAAWAQRPGS
jgi:pantothenate kinase type III